MMWYFNNATDYEYTHRQNHYWLWVIKKTLGLFYEMNKPSKKYQGYYGESKLFIYTEVSHCGTSASLCLYKQV